MGLRNLATKVFLNGCERCFDKKKLKKRGKKGHSFDHLSDNHEVFLDKVKTVEYLTLPQNSILVIFLL